MTPLCVCCYCYGKIINFTYQCKLELFGVGQEDLTAMNMGMDPIQGGFDQESFYTIPIMYKYSILACTDAQQTKCRFLSKKLNQGKKEDMHS